MGSATAKPIQSVERALRILEQFTLSEPKITLSDLAKKTGLKRTTCYGIAETLLKHKYLDYDESTGKYSLGVSNYILGQLYAQSMEIRAIASPYINQLADKYQTAVHLVVPDGYDAVYIDKVGETESFRILSRVGKRAELFAAAISKVVLAYQEESVLDQLLSKPMPRYTINSITDPFTFRKMLNEVRERKIALDNEELDVGLVCIATPIENNRGDLVAVISVSGISEKMHEQEKAIEKDLLQCAAKIKQTIGDVL